VPTYVKLIEKGKNTPIYTDERTGLVFRPGYISPDLDDYNVYKDLTGIADAISDDIIMVLQDDRRIFGRTEGEAVKWSVARGDQGVGGGGGGSTNMRTGNTPIPVNSNFVDVIFTPAFATTNYVVNVSIINNIDPNPSQYFVTVSNKTINSFRVNLSGWTDTANYIASWMAIHS